MKAKQILTAVMALVIAATPIKADAASVDTEHIRCSVGIVTETFESTDTVYFVTKEGNRFWFTGIEDWIPGDYIIAVFDDKGTATVEDDEIIRLRYIGNWLSGVTDI